jgi:hypothetical protein
MCAYPIDRLVTGGVACTGRWDAQVVDLCEGLETAFAIETGMDLAVRVYPAGSATLLEAFEPGPSTKLVRIWIGKDRSGRGVPVVDGVSSGVCQAEALVRLRAGLAQAGSLARPASLTQVWDPDLRRCWLIDKYRLVGFSSGSVSTRARSAGFPMSRNR